MNMFCGLMAFVLASVVFGCNSSGSGTNVREFLEEVHLPIPPETSYSFIAFFNSGDCSKCSFVGRSIIDSLRRDNPSSLCTKIGVVRCENITDFYAAEGVNDMFDMLVADSTDIKKVYRIPVSVRYVLVPKYPGSEVILFDQDGTRM